MADSPALVFATNSGVLLLYSPRDVSKIAQLLVVLDLLNIIHLGRIPVYTKTPSEFEFPTYEPTELYPSTDEKQ